MFMFEEDQRNDRARWQEFFETFTYKPNFRFDLDDDPYSKSTLRVRIQMMVPDSRENDPCRPDQLWVRKQVPVSQTVSLGHYWEDSYARGHIREILIKMEIHEVDEWFRVNGELVFDPHKDVD